MKSQAVILHKGKEKAIKHHHHWIFSGAVKEMPEIEDGSLLPVRSADGETLGHAYFNRKCSIVGRMVSFGSVPPYEEMERNLDSAISLRQRFLEPKTNAYRLVNGEGDRLPGLIVDRYGNILVIQVTTLGMEKLKSFIINLLRKKISPGAIYEKSNLPSRREEGLSDYEGLLFGEMEDRVEITENGVHFLMDLAHSQKTGFFLDQREMRELVGSLAKGRKVLDCFSYTGGFAVSALRGGATQADCVDISEKAIGLARENFRINGFDPEAHHFYTEDVFEFLRRVPSHYDFLILDPPAFAKKKTDILQAGRAYKDINRIAMQKIQPQGLLLTFSCSHFVEENLFQKIIFEAAQEAGRGARLLQRHRHAFDHPINIYHPQSHYLKGFLLNID